MARADGGGTSSDPHWSVFFFVFCFTFFLTKLKFFYKFNLVLRVLGLGSRLQEVPTIPARGVWGG